MAIYEEELQLSKNQKQILEKKLAQNAYANTGQNKSVNKKPLMGSDYCLSLFIPRVGNTGMTSSNLQVNKRVKITKTNSKNYT